MEKLLHKEDPSLKTESGNTKRNEIERRKKLNSFETDQLREILSFPFFIFINKT